MLDFTEWLKCYESKITGELVLADEVSTGEALDGGLICKNAQVQKGFSACLFTRHQPFTEPRPARDIDEARLHLSTTLPHHTSPLHHTVPAP